MLNCNIIIKCKHQAKFDKKIKIKYDKFANNSFSIKNLEEIKLESFYLNFHNVISFKNYIPEFLIFKLFLWWKNIKMRTISF